MRKRIKTLILGLLFLLVVIGVTLFLLSPQKTSQFKNSAGQVLSGSIAEIRTLDINGVKQRLLIRGRNTNNPLLLHIHGGPGGPDQATVRSNSKSLEDLFTVIYWDQRGAGASYHSEFSQGSLTLDNIVKDGIAITRMLRDEFGKNKIYIQGHSWGSLVGVKMAGNNPELFHAYFGIGQIANSKQAELLSYNYTVNAATEAGDQEALDSLARIGTPPYDSKEGWLEAVMVERRFMQSYEIPGESPHLSMLKIYSDFTRYPEYSIRDKLNSLAGIEPSIQLLWMEAINANLFLSHPKLDIPVYIFQGKYDMHTVTEVAQNYFEVLKAPHKEYISFEESAHWPHIKENHKYRTEIKRIRDSITPR